MMEERDAGVAEVAAQRRWREGDARVVLEAWRGSGQSLAAFGKFYGIHPERLGRWHRLLRRKAGEGVRFHRVRVRLGDAPSAEAAKMELLLAGDRCIRLPPGFDAEDLRRLLTVVGVTE